MEQHLLQTLITAQSIIIATLAIWKQYWISIYKIYDEDNRNPYILANNKYWIVSLISAWLSWAIFSGIIGLILFISLALTKLEHYWLLLSPGIGLSIFTLSILLFTVLISAWPTWKKARSNKRWGTIAGADFEPRNSWLHYPLKRFFWLLFGVLDFQSLLDTNEPKLIEQAVNHAGKFTVTVLYLILIISLFFAVFIEFY